MDEPVRKPYSQRTWRDWFWSNPCNNINSPWGDLVEWMAYGATHCWCCSFIRGFVFGVVTTLIAYAIFI